MDIFDQICFPLGNACIENASAIMRRSTAQNPPYYVLSLSQNIKNPGFDLYLTDKKTGITGQVSLVYHPADTDHPARLFISEGTCNRLEIKPSTTFQFHPDSDGNIGQARLTPLANMIVSLAIKDIERQIFKAHSTRPLSGLHP